MRHAVVLGSGMVGSVMVADLVADGDWNVTIVDSRQGALDAAVARSGGKAKAVVADLSDAGAIKKAVASADIVLGALASRIGFNALRAVIEAGKNYSDISFFAEDALELDALAKKHGVTAVVDCGVAPGMSNILSAKESTFFDEPESLAIYVGGLPRERRWPFQYKAGFAPSDVIEEYTRPTRLVEHGTVVVREALTEPEFLDFSGLGTLEAVNTDGLRSLATTLRVPFMKEKTLRYPGHYDQMRVFAATGLFGTEPVEVNGVKVVPREVTAALMFPKWTYQPGEEDLTVMRISVTGRKAGKRFRVDWDLLDFYDTKTRATSMSRTTAFPCTIVARMIAAGEVRGPGVLAPEHLILNRGTGTVFERLMRDLEARGIRYARREVPLDRS